MTGLALALGAGAGLSLLLPLPPGTVPLLLLLALPMRAWSRPARGRVGPWATRRLLVVGLAGGVLGGAAHRSAAERCPAPRPGPVVLDGRLLAATGRGAVPFAVEGTVGCPTERVWSRDTLDAGVRRRLMGVRKEGYGRGLVLVQRDSVLPAPEGPWTRLRWAPVRWREELGRRLERLYGSRGPLVSALVLARREGLEPELRTAFARAGIAHLLAISGFHVGVIAGLLYALVRGMGLPRGRSGAVAAGGSWAYVALLGFPDAASRAAFILTLVSLARLRGRPGARWGPLSAAFLLLVALEPARVASVGFQLSFLGAAGLVAARAPLETRLRRLGGGRLPDWLVEGTAAGAAATAATLPAVAWHFEEVSLVGIPATLAASPLVSFALPGALASLVLEPVLPGPAAFLAGGVDVLLLVLIQGTARLAELPWVTLWIPREWTALACLGGGAAWALGRARGVRGPSRRITAGTAALALVMGWPLLGSLAGRGTLEIRFLDVGQGDAVALRTPGGRWILVDAGPPWTGRGPGPVVGPLRRLGVGRLEALVLTHPDADHIGGAPDVLASLEVGVVLDPSVPTGKGGYVSLLEEAVARGVPWRRAAAPLRWTVDGVTLEVLHPGPDGVATGGRVPDDGTTPAPPPASNDISVVLLVRWGAFEALLTGDAPVSVERAVLHRIPRGELELLKIGHHGSDTSTDSLLLVTAAPRVGVVSAGRGNRYGHPSPRVLARLEAAGVPVHRTDREGTVRLQARRDGTFRVLTSGGPGG